MFGLREMRLSETVWPGISWLD
uniref:FERM domain-containing protein n=1 Tax=Rhizophora mucronata TaxID=61149 RepID=A0A2P2PGI1_RHIMU